MTDTDNTDNLERLTNIRDPTESILQSLEQTVRRISLCMNVGETYFMCFKQEKATRFKWQVSEIRRPVYTPQ